HDLSDADRRAAARQRPRAHVPPRRQGRERMTARALADVLQPIPRRQRLIDPSPGLMSLPHLEPVTFEAGFFASLARLVVWLGVGVRLAGALLRDWLTGASTSERRAERLRESLERVGGTFVKLGQQIAMRIDLLPWEYCVEFSKMLDRMVP